jgi:hypothetical protein
MDKLAYYKDLNEESLKSWKVILEEIQDFIDELGHVRPEVEVNIEGHSSMAIILKEEVKERLEWEVIEQFLDFKKKLAELLELIKNNEVMIFVEADVEWIEEEIDFDSILIDLRRPYSYSVYDRNEGLSVTIDLYEDIYRKIYEYLCE